MVTLFCNGEFHEICRSQFHGSAFRATSSGCMCLVFLSHLFYRLWLEPRNPAFLLVVTSIPSYVCCFFPFVQVSDKCEMVEMSMVALSGHI